jgi:bisanhydrobacterioruberin hydratase
MKTLSKIHLLVIISLIFYLVGWVGMVFFDTASMAKLTPINLLITIGLVFFSHEEKNKNFYYFLIVSFLSGIIVEIIGVKTGYLFGNYHYGEAMGGKIAEVPILMGVNWFVTLYCAGTLFNYSSFSVPTKILLASLAAVGLDFWIEKIAPILDFWHWENEIIPFYNYVCWLGIGAILLGFFYRLLPQNRNLFACILFAIQWIFFISLSFLCH